MKKILILGGTKNQVPLIESAKSCGYYVVLCDWTTDNPGIGMADRHYRVSTMNRDAVLEVARREHVDGVISNSEPAMVNVAYVAERCGLIGNSVKSIDILTSKVKFRDLQEEVGAYAPQHYVFSSKEDLLAKAKVLNHPFVIKPVRSSGSRGTTIVRAYDELFVGNAYEICTGFSSDGCCAVEEYVEMPNLDVIDGDVFLHKGCMFWNGLFCSTRSMRAPLVPMTQTYPLPLPEVRRRRLEETIEALFLGAGASYGEFNIEAYFTKQNELFVIEINPRQGGNHIPQITKEHSGVDMTKLLVTTAVGDDSYFDELRIRPQENRFLSYQPVFSYEEGIFDGVDISEELKPFVVRIDSNVKRGEKVRACDNASSVVAFVLFEFPDQGIQLRYKGRFDELVVAKVVTP